MAYDTFHSKYISIINECLPLTTTKIKSKKNSNEWITNKPKRYINKKLLSNYIKEKSDTNLYLYKSYKNELTTTIKTAKQNYFNMKIGNNISTK